VKLPAELARFVIVGIGSNVLNFAVYVAVRAAGAPLVAASAAGYLAGLGNSYHFGRTWVFEAGRQSEWLAVARFVAVYAVGGAGMSAIIELLVRHTTMDYRASWLFGAFFAFTNNYLGSRWLVFHGARRDGK